MSKTCLLSSSCIWFAFEYIFEIYLDALAWISFPKFEINFRNPLIECQCFDFVCPKAWAVRPNRRTHSNFVRPESGSVRSGRNDALWIERLLACTSANNMWSSFFSRGNIDSERIGQLQELTARHSTTTLSPTEINEQNKGQEYENVPLIVPFLCTVAMLAIMQLTLSYHLQTLLLLLLLLLFAVSLCHCAVLQVYLTNSRSSDSNILQVQAIGKLTWQLDRH